MLLYFRISEGIVYRLEVLHSNVFLYQHDIISVENDKLLSLRHRVITKRDRQEIKVVFEKDFDKWYV